MPPMTARERRQRYTTVEEEFTRSPFHHLGDEYPEIEGNRAVEDEDEEDDDDNEGGTESSYDGEGDGEEEDLMDIDG